MMCKKGKMAYIAKKIIPPVRPLSSIFVRESIKARHEGKPIPKVEPKRISDVMVPNLPKVGRTMYNREEITPKRTQMKRKRILPKFLATNGPISADTNAAKKKSQ